MPQPRALTERQVRLARAAYRAGVYTQGRLARILGVSQQTISRMLKGLTYKVCGEATRPELMAALSEATVMTPVWSHGLELGGNRAES